MTDYIAEAIEEAWGERCPDFDAECHCCRAWKQYDDMLASLAETLEVATRNEEGEYADRARSLLARYLEKENAA